MNNYTVILIHNLRQRQLQRAAEARRFAQEAIRLSRSEQHKPLRADKLLARIAMLF